MILVNNIFAINSLDVKRLVVFLFVITNIGFYYSDWDYYIIAGQFLLALVAVLDLVRYRYLRDGVFFLQVFAFICFSVLSVFWTVDQGVTWSSSVILLKSALLALIFHICLSAINELDSVFKWIAFACLVYGGIYIYKVGVDDLAYARLNVEVEGLPNINTVATLVAFSVIYYFLLLMRRMNVFDFLLFSLAALILVVLGSRRAIIISILAIMASLNWRGRSKLLVALAMLIVVVCVVYFMIPEEYLLFSVDRALSVFDNNLIDDSDVIRLRLLEFSLDLFSDAPVFGNGYYTFSYLNSVRNSVSYYAHNNYMETLVGLGVIGLSLYYAIYARLLLRCLSVFSRLGSVSDKTLVFFVLLYLFFQLLGHFFISATNDRFVWIFLALASATINRFNSEINKRVGY